MRFEFDFSLGGVAYQVQVHKHWELTLIARSRDPMDFGWDESDNWNMPEFYYATHTHGHCKHPVQVFRRMLATLVPWMRKAQPSFLYFRCSDAKKFRLYQRMLARTELDGHFDIQLIELHAYLTLRQPHRLHR